MKQVKFLTNKENNTIGLYDADFNLLVPLPNGFKVSFFDDINAKKVKPFVKLAGFKRLTYQYDYKNFTMNYYLK